jgi:lipopolysaccharide assembly protein A
MIDKPSRTEQIKDLGMKGRGNASLRSRTSGVWIGMILSAVVLLLLLIFILQNRTPVQIVFLAWTGALPTGVALLFAAIAGVLLVALPGTARMFQLRRAARGGRDRTR